MPRYVDYAEYYDYDNVGGPMTEDIPFYLGYTEETGGPILELACGTGRVMIPIAEAGFTVHGLDFSENMLQVARRKISEKGLWDRVTLTGGDMADFDLPVKGFTMAFVAVRSFMHLFTQGIQLGFLRCVHRHLRPGGLLLMDLYSPRLSKLAQPPEKEFSVRREFTMPNGNRVIHKRRFLGIDLLNQINSEEILFEEYDPDGGLVRTRIVPLETRYTFRYELELLLEKAGFEVQSIFRDYDKNPYDGTGEIIIVAQKPG
ncbi:MAG TPA: class I SAM-dependent methyltransferase [Candidatus Krumholzibacteriaceae bacterium]|nr:class I SAM-dependent methyltransferase [Candidatus Krumholzibacteriaceae bacterium]